MSNQALAVTASIPKLELSVPAEYQASIDSTLAIAVGLTVTKENADEASGVISTLAGFLKEIERKREELTAPALQWQRSIKAYADKLKNGIEAQKKRLNDALSVIIENQRSEAAAAAAEAHRVQHAAQEAARLAEEAKFKAALGGTKKDEKEADRLAKDAEEKQDAALELEIARSFETPAAPVVGVAGRDDYVVEVIDIAAFYAKFPHYCKIEIKLAETKAYIKQSGDENLPGLKVTKKFTAAVRAAASTSLLA